MCMVTMSRLKAHLAFVLIDVISLAAVPEKVHLCKKKTWHVNGSPLMSPPDSFTTPQVAIRGTFEAYW